MIWHLIILLVNKEWSSVPLNQSSLLALHFDLDFGYTGVLNGWAVLHLCILNNLLYSLVLNVTLALRWNKGMLHLFLRHLFEGFLRCLLVLRDDHGRLRDVSLVNVVVWWDSSTTTKSNLLPLLQYGLFRYLLLIGASLRGTVIIQESNALHIVILLASRCLLI